MDPRRLKVLGVVLFVLALALSAFLAPIASAGENDGVCDGLDSGKIDVADPPTVTVNAPPGYVIDEYCVKAGSQHNGFGPVYVDVNPPQTTVVIDYPDKDSISHYSVGYACPPGTTGDYPDECEEEPEEPEEPNGEEPNGEEPEDDVLGERVDRPSSDEPEVAAEVAGRALPFTGLDPAPFVALSGLLAASGLSALVIARRK